MNIEDRYIRPEQQRTGFSVGLGLYILLFVIFMTMYILKRKHKVIQSRVPFISILQSTYGLAQIIVMFLGAIYDYNCLVRYFVGIGFMPFWAATYVIRALHLWREHGRNSLVLKESNVETNHDIKLLWLIKKPIIHTRKFEIIFFIAYELAFLLPSFIIFAVEYPDLAQTNLTYNYTCFRNQSYYVVLEAIVIMSMTIFSVWLLWDVQDCFFIKIEMILCFAIAVTALPFYSISIGTSLFRYREAPTIVISTIITIMFVFTIAMPSIIAFTQQNNFFRGSFKSITTINDENAKEELSECLDDEILRNSLLNFSVKLWCAENVLFLIKAREFRMEATEENIQERARKIWSTFFSPESKWYLNVDESIVEKISESILEGNVSLYTFYDCEKQVFPMVKYGAFKMWKETKDFHKANHRSSQLLNSRNVEAIQIMAI